MVLPLGIKKWRTRCKESVLHMPEPYSRNRRTWMDNSTDPVTVWCVDNNGYIVRIQPLG